MKSIVRTLHLEKHSTTGISVLRWVSCAGVVLLSVAIQKVTGTVVGGTVPGKSFSLGAFSAPSHKNPNGYSFKATGRSSGEKLKDRAEDEGQFAFFTPQGEVFVSPAPVSKQKKSEEVTGWKGYLSEKGPSHVIVEVEVEQEIKPLSDEVWDLIMGNTTNLVSQRDLRRGNEMVKVEHSTVTIPKVQIDDYSEVQTIEVSEPQRIHKEENEEDSAITDDAAESYQQLMELFNRPVFATPANEFGDADSMLSFRVPENQPSPTIRNGSSARFEIRR